MDIFWYPDGTNTIQARFRAEHAIGNPFCVAGKITYDWRALVYRDGYYTLEGDYYPVPHHGIYLATGLTGWRIVHERKNQGFACLTGICGKENIRAGNL
ncbi:hypothetical protein [Actinopolyspora mortivallis]|uniref:hypothetical protein n=1 Tax=Actinopolyspora mortivallis TaxID=33906 RepID=UPI0003719265|nr:hypothetical protein [Actinopolyspora mortivallis]